jgi:raffinose/stachyose/melibiose transport system permease protein
MPSRPTTDAPRPSAIEPTPAKGRPSRHLALPAGRFLLPAVLLYGVVFALPMLLCVPLSLTNWNGITRTVYVGLSNFEAVFTSLQFYAALRHNVIILVALFLLANTVALGLALLIERQPAGHQVYRTLIFLPAVVSFLATGFIWDVLLDPIIGVVNPLLKTLGLGFLQHEWLASPRLALPTVILVSWWQWGGVPMAVYTAGLRAIPDELLDAAEVDGAAGLVRFRYVVLPLLRPAVVVTTVLTFVTAFQTFAVVYVLEGVEGAPIGRTDVISTFIYRSFGDIGYDEVNALAVMAILGVGLLVMQLWFRRRSFDV